MKVIVRNETIPKMLEIVKNLKNGQKDLQAIESVLNHPDYQMEFKRYGANIEKETFIDYLTSFWTLNEDDISNPNLKYHHRFYMDLYEDIDTYLSNVSMTDIKQSLVMEQAEIAQKGLPDDLDLGDVHMVMTLGIGGSFGYIFDNHIHFDYLQLVKNSNQEAFHASIAHELHHVGFSRIVTPEKVQKLSLETLFYCYFAGEGLAVKYCNNAEGVLSKAIYDGPKNIGLDPFSWRYLNNDFKATFERFKQTIALIRQQSFSQEDMQKELRTFWMSPYTHDQSTSEKPKLLQLRLYSFGNELWGVIHDAFGKEKVYETLDHLEDFPKVYHQALTCLGIEQFTLD